MTKHSLRLGNEAKFTEDNATHTQRPFASCGGIMWTDDDEDAPQQNTDENITFL